jgi:hypothetical protein
LNPSLELNDPLHHDTTERSVRADVGDGRTLTVRPMHSGDTDGLAALYAELSDEDRFRRSSPGSTRAMSSPNRRPGSVSGADTDWSPF